MIYSTVLFDLDGTLIQSGPGIFAAVKAVMRDMDLSELPEAKLHAMVGPPLADGFRDVLGIPEDRLQEAMVRYRKKAETVGLDLIFPYPGVPELLSSLKDAGAVVGVVTSKITPTATAHLQRFGLAPWIDYIRGGFPGGSADKLLLLETAILELGAPKETTVMVGDRRFDLEAAAAAGVNSIGVLYGYGEESELAACKPTHMAESVKALKNILLG